MRRGGWAQILHMEKAHYFVDNFALCGGWIYLSSNLEQRSSDDPDNFGNCVKKLAEERCDEVKVSELENARDIWIEDICEGCAHEEVGLDKEPCKNCIV